jgi:hypothetical protein
MLVADGHWVYKKNNNYEMIEWDKWINNDVETVTVFPTASIRI